MTVQISTTFDLPGHRVVETRGLAWGLIVRSIGVAKGFRGGIKSLRAGELSEYTEVVDMARRTAVERLVAHVQELGGNAVIGVRFDSSELGNGLAEFLAYGTVAVVEPVA